MPRRKCSDDRQEGLFRTHLHGILRFWVGFAEGIQCSHKGLPPRPGVAAVPAEEAHRVSGNAGRARLKMTQNDLAAEGRALLDVKRAQRMRERCQPAEIRGPTVTDPGIKGCQVVRQALRMSAFLEIEVQIAPAALATQRLFQRHIDAMEPVEDISIAGLIADRGRKVQHHLGLVMQRGCGQAQAAGQQAGRWVKHVHARAQPSGRSIAVARATQRPARCKAALLSTAKAASALRRHARQFAGPDGNGGIAAKRDKKALVVGSEVVGWRYIDIASWRLEQQIELPKSSGISGSLNK